LAPLFDNFICGSPFLNLYLIETRTIKGHHGGHYLRNRTNLLLTIAVAIFFAALRRSPTPSHLLMMIALVAALCTLDQVNTLRTGRAYTWMNGTATREHRPAVFWKYIYEGYAFLGLCVIGFFSVLLWPDFFR
jgi:hypothetical protein